MEKDKGAESPILISAEELGLLKTTASEADAAHMAAVLRGDLDLLGPADKQQAWLDSLTVGQRLDCALRIFGRGAVGSGIDSRSALMWPYTKQATAAQLEREAFLLVRDALVELLAAQPPEVIQRIQKRRDERLSFEYE